jgi:tetratricopeptide (TPR) repeat protein
LNALAPEAADRVLARLAGSSLLTFSLDGAAVTAHRLVMRVIRENLAADNTLTAVCESAARLLGGLAASRWENWYEDRAATRDLVEQITALDESATRCPPGGDLDRLVLRVRGWAASLLNLLGDSAAQSIVIGERLVAASERVLGPDHSDTRVGRNNLANAYQAAGRFDEAITLHEQVLAARERVLGPDHRATLASRNNLANAYRTAGRLDEMTTLHEQVLADRERVLGPDHPDTLRSRNNLAAAYRAAGRLDEATTLHEQVLADRERVQGPDHPDTLSSRNHVASVYQAAGRTNKVG